MYKLKKDTDGVVRSVQKDNAFIPFEPTSIDYQEYLDWLAEGNTPEPAEEQ